ncbi:MAG TPA: hypothetical protein VFJ57_06355 [Solirubrobacterales bacterium]|nr:hypothetical protein [Solirubrobacterales bacterium]
MSNRKCATAITVLFALTLSAFSASSASGAGAELFTCAKTPLGDLFGPHCLKTSSGDETRYKHLVWETGLTTGSISNINTAAGTSAAQSAILRSALAGVNTEVTCKTVEGSVSIANKEEGGVAFGHTTGTSTFSGCVVKAPAEKGCKVKGEAITTEEVTAKTIGSGEEFEVKPLNAESKFATITIEGCSIAALNNSFSVAGSIKPRSNGATLTTTHAQGTTAGTLKFGGQKAGLEAALTVKAHKPPKEGEEVEETKAISVTPKP